MTDTYEEYLKRMSLKKRATEDELAMYHPLSKGRFEIEVEGKVYYLSSEDEHDNMSAEEKDRAGMKNPYWDELDNAPRDLALFPDIVDHRVHQTPVKDQFDRGTCVCFAALANIEAILTRQGKTIALSEQYANWLFMKMRGGNQCDDGLRTTLAAHYLSISGVCEEREWPYEDQLTVRQHCASGPSGTASSNAKYGIAEYRLIDRPGLFGPSIANPVYLESLLYHGHDIVFGTHVAWGEPNADGILDVKLDKYGNPLSSRGGHAMVIVGYDKTGPLPFFILKNSWGMDTGDSGYYYLSYDYVREYSKYGYIVHRIREDMTT